MSVMFVVAPAVAAVGWPLLCGAIAAASASLGYKALATDARVDAGGVELEQSIDITLENSSIVAESMKRESRFVITRDDITATFERAANGRCAVHVAGKNRSEHELNAIGKELVGRVTQQYAYNKVMTELKSQGFTVNEEEVSNDQTIRIHVSKFV